MERTKGRWNVNDDVLYQNISLDEFVKTLQTLEKLTDKYPKDDYLLGTIDILRDEVCQMFGGKIDEEAWIKPEDCEVKTETEEKEKE